MADMTYRQRVVAYASAIFKMKAANYFGRVRRDDRLWK